MNQKLLLIGAIALALVGVGSYVLGTQKSQPNISNPVSISPTAVEPNDISDEATNWKTYTNTDYNFSLKYPKQFTIKVDYFSAKDRFYTRDGSYGLYRLLFLYYRGRGFEKYSGGYEIKLFTSSNKTIVEQFSSLIPNLSLLPFNYIK